MSTGPIQPNNPYDRYPQKPKPKKGTEGSEAVVPKTSKPVEKKAETNQSTDITEVDTDGNTGLDDGKQDSEKRRARQMLEHLANQTDNSDEKPQVEDELILSQEGQEFSKKEAYLDKLRQREGLETYKKAAQEEDPQKEAVQEEDAQKKEDTTTEESDTQPPQADNPYNRKINESGRFFDREV